MVSAELPASQVFEGRDRRRSLTVTIIIDNVAWRSSSRLWARDTLQRDHRIRDIMILAKLQKQRNAMQQQIADFARRLATQSLRLSERLATQSLSGQDDVDQGSSASFESLFTEDMGAEESDRIVYGAPRYDEYTDDYVLCIDSGEGECSHDEQNEEEEADHEEIGLRLKKVEPNAKKVTLELGGKSLFIVCEDADADKGFEMAHVALFFNQGLCCCAGSHTRVHERVYEEFLEKANARAAKRVVGDPFKEGIEQGPRIDKDLFDEILRNINSGIEGRATIETGGERFGSNGYYIKPTVFSDVKDDMLIAKEEIFGPVQSILKYNGARTSEVFKVEHLTRYVGEFGARSVDSRASPFRPGETDAGASDDNNNADLNSVETTRLMDKLGDNDQLGDNDHQEGPHEITRELEMRGKEV